MPVSEIKQLAEIPERIAPSDRHGQKRWKIVMAAAELFIKKGSINTGVRDIAEASGITIGTIYYYFKSKDDIIDAFVDYSLYGTDYFQKVAPAVLNAVGPEEGLRLAIKGYTEYVDRAQNIVLFWHQETKNVRQEVRKRLLDNERVLMGLFENMIEIGKQRGVFNPTVDSRLAAHNILAMTDMWAFRRWDIGRQYSLDSFIDKEIDFIMRGLSGQGTGPVKRSREAKGRL